MALIKVQPQHLPGVKMGNHGKPSSGLPTVGFEPTISRMEACSYAPQAARTLPRSLAEVNWTGLKGKISLVEFGIIVLF